MAGRTATIAVVAGATTALLTAGLGPAAGSPRAGEVSTVTPMLNVVISHGNFQVHGPTSFQAGRVNLSLTVTGKESETEIVQFTKHYDFAGFKHDFGIYERGQGKNGESKQGIAALDHLVRNTTFYGGLDVVGGKTATGTVVLPQAGTYVIYNDTAATSPHTLTVTGPEVQSAVPASSGTITATSDDRFGGAKTAAAKGTLTFSNVSSGSEASPHFLVLQHVKTGTTRQDVLKFLKSGSHGRPPFARSGTTGTDVLGAGQSMTLDVDLPSGEYVEMCFFPDLDNGMPHALMGMVGTITLK